MRLIKFGGSVITRVDPTESFDAENLTRLASELKGLGRGHGMILVHGTGHIGKPYAVEHGFLADGLISADQTNLIAEIKGALRSLNARVVEILVTSGVPAFAASPALFFDSCMKDFRQDNLIRELTDQLEQKCVPVFFGDLMPLPDGRHQVFSSDRIMAILARRLLPRQVIFLTNVPGVFGRDEHGKRAERPMRELTRDRLDEVFQGQSDADDVSGGMQAKIRLAIDIASYTDECVIASGVEEGVLAALLSGKPVACTKLIGERPND